MVFIFDIIDLQWFWKALTDDDVLPIRESDQRLCVILEEETMYFVISSGGLIEDWHRLMFKKDATKELLCFYNDTFTVISVH